MKTISLATIGALIGTAATALGMTCFAVLEYSTNPALTWTQLFSRHAMHVALLFLPSYVLLAFGFSMLVMRPIRRLEGELYRLGTGHLGPVELGSRVRELKALERGVNLMAQRMAQRTENDRGAHSDVAVGQPRVKEAPPVSPQVSPAAPAESARH